MATEPPGKAWMSDLRRRMRAPLCPGTLGSKCAPKSPSWLIPESSRFCVLRSVGSVPRAVVGSAQGTSFSFDTDSLGRRGSVSPPWGAARCRGGVLLALVQGDHDIGFVGVDVRKILADFFIGISGGVRSVAWCLQMSPGSIFGALLALVMISLQWIRNQPLWDVPQESYHS